MSESLYIHVPFCLKKCRYCDFYSETDQDKIEAYVNALAKEIQIRADAAGDLPLRSTVETVYFGGGTPSLLPLSSLEIILDTLHRNYSISEKAEITLEANPGTLDGQYLKGIKGMGVNRLSIGVQSFSPQKLSLLGRIHTGEQAGKIVQHARAAGFENIGLDLIFGLPGESQSAWKKDIDKALGFEPEHLSCYMLTLEPGTPLYNQFEKGSFLPMAPERQVDMFSFTSDYLEVAGYDHYEISNFAHGKSNRSRHNSGYWQMVPYAGFGPSAHSLAYDQSGSNEPVRSWNMANLSGYIKCLEADQLPVEDKESITVNQQLLEMVMVRLRTVEGIELKMFNALFETSFTQLYTDLIETLACESLGGISGDGKRFALTRAGWARLDSIVEEFAEKLL